MADFLRSRGVEVLDDIVGSNPDAAHIRGLLDGLDAYEVQTVYLSGDPKGTSTFNTFMRGVRDESSWVKEVRAGYQTDWVAGGWIHESRSPQPLELAFQRRIGDKTATAELVRA